VYEYYRIEKQKSINVVVYWHSLWSTAAASSCQFLVAIQKFIQSQQSATFITKFLSKSSAPQSSKMYKFLSKIDLRRRNPCLHESVICYHATRIRYLNKEVSKLSKDAGPNIYHIKLMTLIMIQGLKKATSLTVSLSQKLSEMRH